MDTAEKTSSTISEQIEFAWHNFEDQQAIIRAADLKAGYLVPFLLFFGASTIPLGTEVVPKMRFGQTMLPGSSAASRTATHQTTSPTPSHGAASGYYCSRATACRAA